MIKKFNNKLLLGVFALLLVAAIVLQMINQQPERNFRSHLAKVDTSKIDKIEIINRGGTHMFIEKAETHWNVKLNNKKARADAQLVNSLMQSFDNLKVKKRVGVSKEQWKKHEVTDSLGTRLKLYEDGELAADLMIGRFSYQKRGQSYDMSTNARNYDEDETYSIDGQLSMVVRRDFNGFRDKTLLAVDPNQVSSIEYSYPADSSFTLAHNEEKWNIDRQQADSANMQEYLKNIKNMTAQNFTDAFEPNGEKIHTITVKNISGQQYEIEAYRASEKFIMRTTQNENAVFSESKRIFDRLFKSPSYFVKGS
ncbi:MAG: DUF4340 domain-containing protein [Salinivirgaceae bacterium]|jgi:hypothetical protein|nr:DUF4340 domain-containing protein [Salinivirgaceae bacterium]